MAHYTYGIIQTTQDWRFGPIGLFEEEVLTIGFEDIAMIVSRYDEDDHGKINGTRKNLLTHQRVVEAVMVEHTVLPVTFGCWAESHDEVQNMLSRQYATFRQRLRLLDNRIELGIKASWTDMKQVYEEIVANNEQIGRLKARLAGGQQTAMLIEVGKLVEEALLAKKEAEGSVILEHLRVSAADYRVNANLTENMFFNGAFLVSKGREREFDLAVNELAEQFGDRVQLRYVGPLPPYNFVDINVEAAEWEK